MDRLRSYMKDFGIATFAVIVLTLMYLSDARAATVTLSWTLPVENCDQSTILPGDLTSMEIYISTNPIPASDVSCGTVRDVPPTGGTVTVVTPAPNTTQIDIDLAEGETYFFRARVQGQGGEWSNFSGEASRDIPFPRPGIPSITIIQL